MITQPSASCDSGAPPAETTAERTPMQRAARLGVGSAVLAATQAACAAIVLVNGIGLLLGIGTVITATGSTFLHSAYVAVPLLTLSGAGALLNVYVLSNRWRLRRCPSARWRMQPLSRAEKRQAAYVLALSLITSAIIVFEAYTHPTLHR